MADQLADLFEVQSLSGLCHSSQVLGETPPEAGGSVTTYYYRTVLGVRGSTTDPGLIPAGSIIERVT